MDTAVPEAHAAMVVGKSLKGPGQICWPSLAYVWRLVGTGVMLEDIAAKWPKNKVCNDVSEPFANASGCLNHLLQVKSYIPQPKGGLMCS